MGELQKRVEEAAEEHGGGYNPMQPTQAPAPVQPQPKPEEDKPAE